jgi:hypothetical protein
MSLVDRLERAGMIEYVQDLEVPFVHSEKANVQT